MNLKSFAYQNVKLLDSHWKGQRDETIELYLAHLDNDDVLHESRLLAGLPSHVNGLPGWGPSIGQYFGAYAKLYSVTNDQRIFDKLTDLFEGWCACADASEKVLDHGTYVYEKFLGGLLDMYEYIGNEKAAKYISLLTDHAIKNFDPSIPRDGLQDGRMKGQIEWYTLPENLYRAYTLLGDEKYKRFADEWLYDYMWDKVLKGDPTVGPRHAYSQINSFSSAARAYMVSGEEKYLDIIKAAYDHITSRHTFATGGYGPGEILFGENPGYLGDSLISPWSFFDRPNELSYKNFAGGRVARSDAWGSCEVSCCAWAVFKLCHYLLCLTGDARYGAWAEQMLINGTGGQIPITKEGKVFYYAAYFRDGALKTVEDRRLNPDGRNHYWQCCTGTFPQDVAEYANMLYYFTDDALCISQYLPSTVDAAFGGKAITLHMLADFPREPRLRIRIDTQGPVRFTLRIRVPSWANGTNEVWINEEKTDLTCTPDTWLEIDREFINGDSIRIEWPYALAFKAIDIEHPDLVALTYGPLVLVSTEMTLLEGDREHPHDWIKPVDGVFGTFTTLPGHAGPHTFLQRKFVPYYTLGEMQWYYMYNEIRAQKKNSGRLLTPVHAQEGE